MVGKVTNATNAPGTAPASSQWGGARWNRGKAYCQGRAAFLDGALQTANPYDTGSGNYTAWDDGWTGGSTGRDKGPCAR